VITSRLPFRPCCCGCSTGPRSVWAYAMRSMRNMPGATSFWHTMSEPTGFY
jgi:hypothetical protein